MFSGRILSFSMEANSSSYEGDSRTPAKAVNGDMGDYFSTLPQETDPWWRVDFGSPHQLSHIELRPRSNSMLIFDCTYGAEVWGLHILHSSK